jgi:cobalamin biosynthesis Mg chelatase CobN
MNEHLQRKKVLEDLVSMNGNIEEICNELTKFETRWDDEQALAHLTTENVRQVLERYISGDIPSDELHRWAESIEMRDDIEYQPQKESGIANVISFLANRDINGPVSKAEAESWVSGL